MSYRKVLDFSANAISGSHITLQEYAAFEAKCKNLKTNKKLPSKSKLLEFAEFKEVLILRVESILKAF